MKYLLIVANGLTDQPIAEKDNQTPLQIAETPNLDRLAREGATGSLRTIPDSLHAGNDVSYLAVLGYDPERYNSGAGSFTAAALGVGLHNGEVPLCCDFVTLQTSHNDMVMKDFTAGYPSSADSRLLLQALQEQITEPHVTFHHGGGYQNLMVMQSSPYSDKLVPPNELVGEGIRRFMPAGDEAKDLVHIMSQAQIILHNHPFNQKRRQENQDTINSVWLWGNGVPADIPPFAEQHDKSACVVTSSLLFQGIAKSAGMEVIAVEKTGGPEDNPYQETVQTALRELEQRDVVYLHISVAEDLSLLGLIDDKILAIEDFDSQVMSALLDELKGRNDVKMLVVVNHLSSVNLMRYSKDAVPYLAYPGKRPMNPVDRFDENIVSVAERSFKEGPALIEAFFKDEL